jgi:glycosidase
MIIGMLPSDALFQLLVSREARTRYGLDEALFGSDGTMVLADPAAAKRLAHAMNEAAGPAGRPGGAVRAGDLNALGLLHETLHLMVSQYRRQADPRVLADALDTLAERFGTGQVEDMLAAFVDEFPPPAVWRGEITAASWLAATTEELSHREVALEELVLLALANDNPAWRPFRELFDDDRLRRDTVYGSAIGALDAFFTGRPELAPTGETLLELLRGPMRASPDSIEGQLRYVRDRWGMWLGDSLRRLLSGLDLLAEESKPFFGFGPGPVEVPAFVPAAGEEHEPEAYSADLDWMPSVVLLAKNVYVWLHQLSRRYGREIRTLDDIPEDELDVLASRGFTGLWLIGVWQRSVASARIKQWMGDHDAVASAYSLDDYRVADDLGGEAAFDDLKERAWRRGIRMATDMVPNHVGIDSRWVIEHPDWFIQRRDPPFPSYTFTGKNLGDDERVGIYLEDHYWSRSDAAVVFKRVDHHTGDGRYIYHGNDGTSMPWNDTAQLDYRNPEVREAVIQTILHVARRSPVIRFDAAMTLTKKHYHRLWFPEPGSGGDIPSRSEFGMTRAEFDRVMPHEFWREVVDRVAAEAPDTLLLAEAFWLLEGYFVRTLGMHRVYNSAFMNMLRDERNAEYRQLIKNTLEYDPQILKRYVNFMSNPDERTAVDQFGGDGKYFGVATLMATMPGLPMFGHGQVEGFGEKYGMEFQRPRLDESPNEGLVHRHERQLFPLLHRRRIFAEVDRFLLYDFEHADGGVDENVFAYSNERDGHRTLVVYHNRYGDTRGRIRISTAKAVRIGDETRLDRWSLSEGLGLETRPDRYLILRDAAGDLEYLRSCHELTVDGLWLELGAYELRVFWQLEDVVDSDGRWRELHHRLAGRGVTDVREAMRELDLDAVLKPLQAVLDPALVRRLRATGAEHTRARADLRDRAAELLREVDRHLDIPRRPVAAVVGAADDLAVAVAHCISPTTRRTADDADVYGPALAGWRVAEAMAAADGGTATEIRVRARDWLDDWLVARTLEHRLADLDEGHDAARAVQAIRMVAAAGDWVDAGRQPREAAHALLTRLLDRPESRLFLGINRHQDVLWYRGETILEALEWLEADAKARAADAGDEPELGAWIDEAAAAIRRADGVASYRVDRLLGALSDPDEEPASDASSEEVPDAGDAPDPPSAPSDATPGPE